MLCFDYLEKAFPGKIVPVAVHNGDRLAYLEYDQFLSLGGYPAGRVNRNATVTLPMGDEDSSPQAATKPGPTMSSRNSIFRPWRLSRSTRHASALRPSTSRIEGDRHVRYRAYRCQLQRICRGLGEGYSRKSAQLLLQYGRSHLRRMGCERHTRRTGPVRVG